MIEKPTYEQLEIRIKELEQDTFGRRQLEKVIAGDKNNLGFILDLSPDPIMILHKEQFRFVNTEFTKVFGYSKESVSLVGSLLQLVQDKDKKDVKQKYETRLTGKRSSQFHQIDIVAKDGKLIPCETFARLITIKGQKSVLVIIRDVTERIQFNKALEESHERLAIALKGSNSGIWEWNLKTNEIFYDNIFFQMAGYEPNEFAHSYENWKKLVHSDDLEEVEKKITSYIKGKKNKFAAEFRFKTKSDDWMWILGQGEISEYADGKSVRFTGTNVDITDRKKAELALKKSHEHLVEKVKERTSDLKEMNTTLKVLLKKRDADEKNTQEQILSNVSSLIIPYIKKLAKTNMDYEQQTLLKIVEANVAEIISPISHRFTSSAFGLTLTEIKVANLIKEGKKSKEIARILTLSPRTIDKYREKIRTKLSVKNKKVNLQSYLASME